MEATVEKITPKMAAKYLAANCGNNRKINKQRVHVYAADMAAGAWQLNGESIRFNNAGVLLDGQHRLSAIVESGATVEMLVVRDVGGDVDLYDRGFGRNTKDSLLMGGISRELANNVTCAMAKMSIYIDTGKNYVSDYAIREFLLDNEEDVQKAYAICMKNSSANKKIGRLATSNAIFALAVYDAIKAGEPLDELRKFCDVFSSGFYDGKDQTAAVIIRNDVQGGTVTLYGGQVYREKALRMFEKAIYDFCRHTPRQVTYKNWDKPVYRKGEAA